MGHSCVIISLWKMSCLEFSPQSMHLGFMPPTAEILVAVNGNHIWHRTTKDATQLIAYLLELAIFD